MSAIWFILVAMTTVVILTHHPIYCATVHPLNGRKVVLMSMDGFRYNYLSKTDTPNFDKLIASGVKVPYVNNTFATWTFPCHYTIVTGLYEESHGIIANRMYDPQFNEIFTKRNHEAKWWDGAEPIWDNAVKSGLKTGVYFWPGSETRLHDTEPTKWMPYNQSTPFKERVDTVLSRWLMKDDFDFGLIYFHEPDSTGHWYGPESPQMVDTIKRMDDTLGYFMDTLKANNLTERVDFILTSDHGMTSINETSRLIVLSDHVNNTLLQDVIIDGAVAHLRPTPGNDILLAKALQGIDHCKVFLKKDIPDRYYYKHHRRVMPVVVIADEGWTVRRNYKAVEHQKGDHGYSSDSMNMKPIFMATGPSFKSGVVAKPIKSVDIYPLLCHLLKLTPAPNNGSFVRVADLLVSDTSSRVYASLSGSFLIAMFGSIVLKFI